MHTPRWIPNGMTNSPPADERRPTTSARLMKMLGASTTIAYLRRENRCPGAVQTRHGTTRAANVQPNRGFPPYVEIASPWIPSWASRAMTRITTMRTTSTPVTVSRCDVRPANATMSAA
jgi:hypothetical protein